MKRSNSVNGATWRRTAETFTFLAFAIGASALQSAAAADAQAEHTSGPVNTLAPGSDRNTQDLQEIIVTGSRIRGAAPVGSAVITVSREDIVDSSATSVSGLMEQVPQVLNFGISEDSRSTPGGAGNINYSSGVNIHGIGPAATLTLLNGKRFVQSGSSGGLPDPNDIPTIMLQRVEIVADGASAIYGSDAIAGVVNLITRREFDGVETRMQGGFAGQYNESNFGLIAGKSWDSGNVTMSFEQSRHSNLNGNDRGFYAGDLTGRGGGDFRSTNCASGNVVIGGTSYALPGLRAGTANQCDNLKSADLIPWQKRDGGTLSVTQTATEWLSLYFDGLLTRRNFRVIPGAPNGTFNVPNTNPYFVAPTGLAPASETVGYSFAQEAPVNVSAGYSKVYELTPGIKVHLPHEFQIDTSFSYGHDESLSNSSFGLNNGALGAALASTNPAAAFNPFGGVNSPAVISGIFNSGFYAPGINIEKDYLANLSGPLVALPGGEVRVAIGYEHIYDSILTGGVIGPPGRALILTTFASQTVNAKFGEILIPVVGSGNSIPGIHSFDITLAKRTERYSDVGSTSNPKYGFNWAPIDGITIHGSYGTSFRAPSLTSVHGPLNALFVQTYQTPTGPIQGLTLSGYKEGNPLAPETAITRSLGVDFKLPALPGFKASATYFDVNYSGQISGILSNLTVLQNPQIEAEYGSLIVRNPPSSLINSFLAAGYPVLGPLPNPLPVFVYGQATNLGTSRSKGIDFQVNQRLGEFSVGLNGAYFLDYKTSITPSSPEINTLNTIFNPPKFRARLSGQWQHGAAGAVAFVNYTGSYTNNNASPVQQVSAYTTVDVRLAYDLGFGTTSGTLKNLVAALSVTNLFDRDPPFVNIAENGNGGGGFDPTAANPIGRLVSLNVTKRW